MIVFKALSSIFGFLISIFESIAKIGAGIAVVIAVALHFNLWELKAFLAETSGPVGLVKYELGTVEKIGFDNVENGPRVPTSVNGQWYLLRSGQKEPKDLKRGDILRALSTREFREANGCDDNKPRPNCTLSPSIFRVEKGECVVVLQSAKKDEDVRLRQGPYTYSDVKGAWVKVAPALCALFS